jgi:nicotinamidase-related amidase
MRSRRADVSRTLDLPCRYYRVYTDEDVPCREADFGFVERRLPLPAPQTALVLVDVWATHYIDSWFERAARITRERIVPLMEAARQAGVLVVHAPSPFVVERRHPESMPDRPPASHGDGWPPPDFRGIYRSGEHAAFGRAAEPRLARAQKRYETEQGIAEIAAPQPGDEVIADGPQLHDLLRERGILHLVYAGFATNWCVIGRDYGVIAMNGRGYNIVLVRDATDGVEFHDTVDERNEEQGTATQIAVREIETKYGWSTTTEQFLRAAGG